MLELYNQLASTFNVRSFYHVLYSYLLVSMVPPLPVFAMQPCCLVIQLNTCGALPTVMFTILHFDINIAVQSTGGHVRIAHRLRERPRSARFPRQQQQQRLTDGPGTANHRVGRPTNHFTLPCRYAQYPIEINLFPGCIIHLV